MRYSVGERIPFVSIFFDEVIGYQNKVVRRNTFGTYAYMPWEHTNLEIVIEPMVCVSHHKVPGDYEPEEKYDGFIFHGSEQSVWHNQYPKASYGQMDDSQDRQVSPAVLTEENLWLHREDARIYLEKVLRGAQYYAGRSTGLFNKIDQVDHGKVTALIDFYHSLRLKVGDALENKVLIHQPLVLNFTDGRPSEFMNDIRDVVIMDSDDPELKVKIKEQNAWEQSLLQECLAKEADCGSPRMVKASPM